MLCRYGPKESRFEKSSATTLSGTEEPLPRTCRATSPHPYRVVSYRTAL